MKLIYFEWHNKITIARKRVWKWEEMEGVDLGKTFKCRKNCPFHSYLLWLMAFEFLSPLAARLYQSLLFCHPQKISSTPPQLCVVKKWSFSSVYCFFISPHHIALEGVGKLRTTYFLTAFHPFAFAYSTLWLRTTCSLDCHYWQCFELPNCPQDTCRCYSKLICWQNNSY